MGKNSRKRRAEGRGGCGEAIVFDPAARQEYLKGFSKRKQERRAYGLAMQKVKDRKARLEQRAELKQALKEQIEQAEKQKEELLEEYMLDLKDRVYETCEVSSELAKQVNVKLADQDSVDRVDTYQDTQTQSQWGGEVIVRTSTKIPGEEDDAAQTTAAKRRKVDEEQEYAGKVEKYLHTLKGKMPAKKRKDHNKKQKGVHGAAGMKGIGGSGSEFKMAQRALVRSQAKQKGTTHQPSKRKRR